jgi:hypothetical protein
MRRLRVRHLRFLVPFLLVAWRAGLALGDNSFLWHVRAGELQLESGRVLTTDPFSFTAFGHPWRTQSWLAELAYAWLERVTGGIDWVPVMKLVLMSATIALLGLVIHKVVGGRSGLVLVGLLMLVWQGTPFGIARPALIGFLFLATMVAITYMERHPLWLLPPLFWLWASIHGMFVVGLGLLLLDALRRRSRRQGIAVALSVLATALTAHGLGTWWIVVQFFKNRGALDLISEWQPPDFTNPFLLPLLLVIIGVVVAAVLDRIATADLWIIVPFVVFGVVAERNVWPAYIVLIPFAMSAFPVRDVQPKPSRTEAYALNWGIAVVLVAVGLIPVLRPIELNEDRFPSMEALDALSDAPVFNGSAVGGYMIYAAWPEHPVFIDDRAELYGAEGFRRFHDLESGIGVEDTFAALGISQVLVDSEWPIVEYLELLGWQYAYQDEFFVVMME